MLTEPETLTQEFTLGYTYTRSTGPVIGRFLAELRRRNVVGIKDSGGNVIVPPVEYDPVTAQALTEFVDVADTGVIQSWCWVKQPRQLHPLDKPFAWAMVLLDGADTPLVHAVDAGKECKMSTGMRVKARWADKPCGHISDIICFDAKASIDQASVPIVSDEEQQDLSGFEQPIYLDYTFTASASTQAFLQQIIHGQLTGQRCPQCLQVYVPARGICAACGVATQENILLPDKATVISFTIVHIPIPNNSVKPPYVIANILLDNANVSFLHVLSECVNEEIHIGQRVQAVWKPGAQRTHALDSIQYFKPIDEPDAAIESTTTGRFNLETAVGSRKSAHQELAQLLRAQLRFLGLTVCSQKNG